MANYSFGMISDLQETIVITARWHSQCQRNPGSPSPEKNKNTLRLENEISQSKMQSMMPYLNGRDVFLELGQSRHLLEKVRIVEDVHQERVTVAGEAFEHERRASRAIVEGLCGREHLLMTVQEAANRVRDNAKWAVIYGRLTWATFNICSYLCCCIASLRIYHQIK